MEWRCFAASLTRLWSNESREKLIWGRELYVDSTQVNANADLDSLTPRFAVEARKEIQTHLAALFAAEESQQEQEKEATEVVTALPEATSPEVVTCPLPTPLPVVLPDATPMRLKRGGTHLGYHVHYVVDGGKARIILQVLVTPSEVLDTQPMRDLIFRTHFRWNLRPRFVTGDTKYGTIENVKALEDAGIRAYVPLPDWEERYEVWSASHFRYEALADQYRCPRGQMLQRVGVVNPDGRQLYRAAASICNDCPVKVQCTTSTQGRRAYRHVGEEYLERVRTYQQTQAYQKAMNKRKVWVEPLFAEARILAWAQALPPAAALAGQLRSLTDRGWTKSQTLAQETGMGTPSVPSKGPLCLFFLKHLFALHVLWD
jgi:Transposase DDE domain